MDEVVWSSFYFVGAAVSVAGAMVTYIMLLAHNE